MPTSPKRRDIVGQIVIYSLYLLAAAVPLVFVYQTYDIFELSKLTFLRLITLVLAGCWVWKTLGRREARGARREGGNRPVEIATAKNRPRNDKTDKSRPRNDRNTFGWFVVAYLGVMTLATLCSPSPRIALLGDYGRFEGLLTLLNYGAVFFLTGALIRILGSAADLKDGSYSSTDKNGFGAGRLGFIHHLVLAAIGGGALVSVYGIAQRFGWDVLVWSSAGVDTTRSFSTLGNPIYVAAYATIILSLALSLFVVERDTGRRVFLGASAILVATCLAMTYSRAGWVGMGVALGVIAGLFLTSRRSFLPLGGGRAEGGGAPASGRRLAAYIGFVMLAIAIIAGAVTLSERNASAPTRSAMTRALSSFNLSGAGLADRVSLWKSGAAMVVDRPILGWGPDTFGTYYPQYRRFDIVTFERETMHLSRPRHQNRVHSDILQQAISGGLLGAAAYIAMIGAFFWLALRRLFGTRRGDDKALLIGTIAGLAGYFVQIQVSFSTIAVSPLVWMLMAIALAVGRRQEESGTSKLSTLSRLTPRASRLMPKLGFGAILAILSLLGILSVMPLAADYYFNNGANAIGREDTAGAKQAFDRALALNPYAGDYADYAGSQFVEAAKRDTAGPAAGHLTIAIAYSDRAVALNPAMPSFRFSRGNAEFYYSRLPGLDLMSARDDALAAMDDFRFAVKQDPYISDYHFNLASVYLRLDMKAEAKRELQAGLRIDPTRADAKLWLKNLE